MNVVHIAQSATLWTQTWTLAHMKIHEGKYNSY